MGVALLAKLDTIEIIVIIVSIFVVLSSSSLWKGQSPVYEVMGEEVSIIVEVVRQEEVVVHSCIPGSGRRHDICP